MSLIKIINGVSYEMTASSEEAFAQVFNKIHKVKREINKVKRPRIKTFEAGVKENIAAFKQMSRSNNKIVVAYEY